MQSFKYKFSDITLKYGLHLGMHVHVNVALRPTSSSSLYPPPHLRTSFSFSPPDF